MPQFDFFSFYTQIFWTFVFLCIFYIIYLKFPIKDISEVLLVRIKLLKAKNLFLGKDFEYFYFYQNVLSKRVSSKVILNTSKNV